jgi:hypothetical protein
MDEQIASNICVWKEPQYSSPVPKEKLDTPK